jgi:hypothetical protein
MGTDVSEGLSPFKETLKPKVADVTKTPKKNFRTHCDLACPLACFSLVSVYQVISEMKIKKKGRTCCLGSESSGGTDFLSRYA